MRAVRLGAWALAPSFAGLLMRGTSLAMPLGIGAGMKIVCNLLLYLPFSQLKPDEARAGSPDTCSPFLW